LVTMLVAESCPQDKPRPAAAALKGPQPWLPPRSVLPELALTATSEDRRVPRQPLPQKVRRESRTKSHLATAISAGPLVVSLAGDWLQESFAHRVPAIEPNHWFTDLSADAPTLNLRKRFTHSRSHARIASGNPGLIPLTARLLA
jgi:hypothetical protein